MSIKAFKKPSQDNLSSLTNAVADYAQQLTKNPLLDYALIKQVKVSTTAVDIPHSLGRQWLGWVVTRKNADINVYETATQKPGEKYITLTASGSGTIDIYLF